MANKPQTNKDHLAFYLEHGISPVRQDITDLGKHLERRGSLYRKLGVPALLIAGKRVLEVGPGSGHNSIQVASCLPASLDLLEPNPRGRQEIAQLYEEIDIPHTKPRIICERLEEFSPKGDYDIAIAEAWIGVPKSEQELIAKLARMLCPGGILITTVSSPIGMLANSLRRILGHILVHNHAALEDKTRVLVDAFGPHLATMEDMSRPYIDWVQDSLLNPGFLTSCLTPEMVFDVCGPDFSFYDSFPKFSTDWRWYKSLHGENRRFNETFLEAYGAQSHNFLDFRQDPQPARPVETNNQLENDCFALMSVIADYEEAHTPPQKDDILALTGRIRDNVAGLPGMADAIGEFESVLASGEVTPEKVAAMTAMKPVFGRELLYISMIRDR